MLGRCGGGDRVLETRESEIEDGVGDEFGGRVDWLVDMI